jgi:hypothetical protein
MRREPHTYHLDQSPFYRLTTRRKLARVFGLTLPEMNALTRSESLYREFSIPKKAGGTRMVENPPPELKKVQKHAARLLGRIRPKDYLFCPVKGRSYVSNAGRHRGNRVIRCLDVRKYFPCTPAWRVYRFFTVVMRCSTDVAEVLTRLATYKGHLPTGSPLSPIMAYYAYYDVWERIAAIAAAHGWTLTVYIDDVTVSGTQVRARHLWKLKEEIHASGLRYHKEKCYIDTSAEITGVIVGSRGLGPPNRQLLKMRDVRRRMSQLSGHSRADTHLISTLHGLRGQLDQIRGAKD